MTCEERGEQLKKRLIGRKKWVGKDFVLRKFKQRQERVSKVREQLATRAPLIPSLLLSVVIFRITLLA